MSELNIDQLNVLLSNKTILDNISCSIPAGKVTGLIGPNGAGKSTLLKSFFKLLPAKGAITYSSKNILSLSAAERATYLSYLPQERELAWAMSVENVIRLGFSHTGANRRSSVIQSEDERLNAILGKLDLLEFRNRSASSLSGGELARVLIARALAQDTPVLLADEPLAGLDPYHQIKIMMHLKAHSKGGKTVLTSIHDLSIAAQWCDHLILLDHGRIVSSGTPAEVLTENRLKEIYKINARIEATPAGLCIWPLNILS